MTEALKLPIGTKALILSKMYYGVLNKKLENLDIDKYFALLYFLKFNNGCKQQFLCNNLAIDKTAMVKIIDYLIKSGIVDRNVNPQDRREHFIVLTKKGVRYAEEAEQAFNSLDEKMFNGVNKEEKQIFESVLNKMMLNVVELPAIDFIFNVKKTARKKKKQVTA